MSKSDQGSESPDTYFAPAERDTGEQVRLAVERVSSSPLLASALEMVGGWVAVLNLKRQVLAVNHALLHSLGVTDPEHLLGLRPGEILNCVHCHDEPGGCGTSRFCATCGAAIAMVASIDSHGPQERECILTYEKQDELRDRAFVVRCCPIRIEGEDLLLICMRDVSDEKRRAALENVFLHDISSLLAAVQIAAGCLRVGPDSEDAETLAQIREAAATLVREVKVQKLLGAEPNGLSGLEIQSVRPTEILRELADLFARHPAARGQELLVDPPADDRPIETDVGLLVRVLRNMVLNGLEAGGPGDQVRLGARIEGDEIEFHVYNRQPIPQPISLRIFQQYFSTKEGNGRGLGTFSMKLLGEKVLGGRVRFDSGPQTGTTFRIRLPRMFGVALADASQV